jgi:hypothetical protein
MPGSMQRCIANMTLMGRVLWSPQLIMQKRGTWRQIASDICNGHTHRIHPLSQRLRPYYEASSIPGLNSLPRGRICKRNDEAWRAGVRQIGLSHQPGAPLKFTNTISLGYRVWGIDYRFLVDHFEISLIAFYTINSIPRLELSPVSENLYSFIVDKVSSKHAQGVICVQSRELIKRYV